MKLDTLIISFLIFGGLIATMSTVYYDFSKSYGVLNITNETNLTDYTQKTRELNTEMENLQKRTTNIAEKGFPLATVEVGLLLFVDIPKVIYASFNVMDQMLKGMTFIGTIAIPTWFTTMVVSILLVIFIFGVIGFLRKKP